MHKLDQKPEAMLRWTKMRGGRMACSGSQTWTKAKAIKSRKARTNNTIISPLLH